MAQLQLVSTALSVVYSGSICFKIIACGDVKKLTTDNSDQLHPEASTRRLYHRK